MSVPEGKRNKNELDVFLKARELSQYTIMITKNRKVFPQEYDGDITAEIVGIANSIFLDAWAANHIRVDLSHKDEAARRKAMDDFIERRRLQGNAINSCVRLTGLISIAKSVFHLKTRRVRYWAGKVWEVRRLLQGWRDSDNKRYTGALNAG